MTQNDLHHLKTWFSGYCASFYSPNREDQQNILLKEEHTHRVCENIVEIARGLMLDERRVLLAEAAALFHDIGRFPQYRKYRTFKDSVSVNHAALGSKVLRESLALASLPEGEQNLILQAVTLHNVFAIPEKLDGDALLFVKMVRDADKLDIWRVFLEYFEMDEDARPTAAGLGLPDTAVYSPDVLACLRRGEMARVSTLRTLNDFKLLQLSWMYDLNFTGSLRMVLERGYIGAFASLLPATADIGAALDAVREYVEKKLERAGMEQGKT